MTEAIATAGDAPTTTETPTIPPGSFLGGETTPPATPAGDTPKPSAHFFDSRFHEGGQFKEGWAQSLKEAGFERLANKAMLAKDESGFLRALDEAQGMIGKKVAVGYPGVDADPDAVAEFRRAAGVPDTPEAYDLKPESLPNGVLWDDKTAGEFAQLAHKHHVPAPVAKELLNLHLKVTEAQAQKGLEQFELQVGKLAETSAATFAKEWGEQAEARRAANSDFVKVRGLDTKDPIIRAALSHPDIVRLVDEARRAFREAPVPGVNSGVFNGSGSPREQAQEIMKANPNYRADPALSKRIADLYALDAQQAKRRGK